MSFTVARRGGTKEVPFDAYLRLLRHRGVDPAEVPRTLEPGTAARWLYVWDAEADARAFADELRKRTKDSAWHVVPVNGPISRGPLSPIEIQVGSQADGWAFELQVSSRWILQRLFPGSCSISTMALRTETPEEHQKARQSLPDLIGYVSVLLTGLRPEQLETLGYRAYDHDLRKELGGVPPRHE